MIALKKQLQAKSLVVTSKNIEILFMQMAGWVVAVRKGCFLRWCVKKVFQNTTKPLSITFKRSLQVLINCNSQTDVTHKEVVFVNCFFFYQVTRY